jgi:ATP-independent RNA helicase DbpA
VYTSRVSEADIASLPLSPGALAALDVLGFERMLPVQAQTLPLILAGRDVLARADTGSGKTVAFGLGLLAVLQPRLDVQALALCPTRELAEQVAQELRRLSCRTPNVKVLTLCGGVPFAPQRASLKMGAHVVVGTPGRVEEHLRKGSLTLAALKVLVLDEADRMLDMGFEPQIQSVLQHVPAERQTLLFSATYPDAIVELSRRYQRDARHVDVAAAAVEAPAVAGLTVGERANVRQSYHRVEPRERAAALGRWLANARPLSTLVFCNTRVECDQIAAALRQQGWVAGSIHGELSQRERQHIQRLFANGSCSVLAATDVAARGWDIAELEAVVNLGLARDPNVHVHRIGRTGRLGRAGMVVNLVAREDAPALAALERSSGQPLPFTELPASTAAQPPPQPPRATLLLGAGKDKKLRPGDILGALTAEGGLAGSDVGAIQIDDSGAYVAVTASCAERALLLFRERKVKGRTVRARRAKLELG